MTMDRSGRHGRLSALALLVLAVGVAVIAAATASAHGSVAPTNSGAPSISGSARENQTLTAGDGTWNNTPTSFSYQWQRCTAAGSGCADITGATNKTYSLATADVGQTIRVIVTAKNADGSASANSRTTGVVAAANGPTNTAKPTISGTAAVGEQLTAANGTWTGGVRSYSYQWQSCSTTGTCANIAGATGQSYNVRSADIGSTVRVAVTAHTPAGNATAYSDQSSAVASAGGTTTVVQTVPGAKDKAPTISWVSLKKTGNRIYARFRVCDDSTTKVKVVQHDAMSKQQGYTRNYSVTAKPCATFARNWLLLARYHHVGARYTATLHAVDKSSKTSRTVSKSLTIH